MKQLVLTGFTGPNHKYPLAEIAEFILAYSSCLEKDATSILADLQTILEYRKGFGGSILLGLNDDDLLDGIVAILPPVDHHNSTLVYLATAPAMTDSSRTELLRSSLKITRGIIQVKCDLSKEDKSWLPEGGYQFHHTELTISRTGG